MSADPWWRVKEWAVFFAGCVWLSLRGGLDWKPARTSKDKWLALLILWLAVHFSILCILPIVRAPGKLSQALWPWLVFTHAILALIWLQDFRQLFRRNTLDFLILWMARICVVLSVYMIFQRVDLDPVMWVIQLKASNFKWLHGNHVVGLMGNPFQAGAALAVLIPAVSYLSFKPGGNPKWRLALAISLVACWFTQSISSFLAAILGAVAGAGKLKSLKAWVVLAIITLAGVAITYFAYPNLLSSYRRVQLWQTCVSFIQQHPIQGIGLGQFKLLGLIDPVPPGYAVRWAHNEWVHFAVELGIPFCFLLAWYFTQQAMKLSRIHAGMFGCLTASIILSFFHIPWHLAPVLVVTGLCLASTSVERS